MSQIGYIILGWLFGILSMLIARWIQTKEDKKKKETEILSETLKDRCTKVSIKILKRIFFRIDVSFFSTQ